MSTHTPDPGLPLLEIQGAVARITLRRPQLRNSLNNDDLHALLAHLDTANQDAGVRVLVLQADTRGQRQPVFSAGYHVSGLDADPAAPNFFQTVPDALEQARPLTVCALGGSVYGGATDLVLACDLRVTQTGVHWRMPACALGLHYYASGLRRYVSRMGLNASKRAFLLAQALPVESLHPTGLFEAIVAPDELEATVNALVQQLLTLAPLAVQATKRSLNEIAAGQYDVQALQLRERMSQHSADFAEGRAAFAERRTPIFQGH